MNFVDPTRPIQGRTFAVSPENVTGAKGGGAAAPEMQRVNPRFHVEPGQTLTLLDGDGPGVIQNMWFGGRHGWHLILRIYWDGNEQPSVEAPLSAFFGYAYYDNVLDVNGQAPVLSSALLSVVPYRGFSAAFQMPFKKHCRITVENRDMREMHVLYYTITGIFKDIPDGSLYFHASYRQAQPLLRGQAYIVIDGIEGNGNFLGVTLAVGLNGRNGCWMVGEVKMYIDDDVTPSINYCGLEDYFGGSYAFGFTDLGTYHSYSTPYAGLYAILGCDVKGGAHPGYNHQPRFMGYRWHVPDPIHFDRNFKMIVPCLGHGPIGYGDLFRRDDYASVAYWYQTLPHQALKPLPSEEDICLY